MLKDLFEFGCFVAVGFILILTLLCSFIHVVGKNTCAEYGDRKGLNVNYEFYSGCWVEGSGGWDLKSTLEKGE